MSAKVKWRENRGAWFLYVCANGIKTAKRYGPTAADKRRAERQAKEINRELVRGQLGLKRRGKKISFDDFAKRWVEEKVLLPVERGLDDAVAPKTAAMREQMVRLHVTPFLGTRDLREIDAATVDALEAHFVRIGSPPSRRSIEIAIGTLRLILADAVSKKLVQANAVDLWKATRVKGKRRSSARARRVAEWKVLDSEEREHLLEGFERETPHYFPFVLFLAETGCRISEGISLAWADVDLARSEARVVRHKTGGEVDYIELSERLANTLARVQPDICPPGLMAFRTPGGSPLRYENFLHRV